jgi:hypothetical protein
VLREGQVTVAQRFASPIGTSTRGTSTVVGTSRSGTSIEASVVGGQHARSFRLQQTFVRGQQYCRPPQVIVPHVAITPSAAVSIDVTSGFDGTSTVEVSGSDESPPLTSLRIPESVGVESPPHAPTVSAAPTANASRIEFIP